MNNISSQFVHFFTNNLFIHKKKLLHYITLYPVAIILRIRRLKLKNHRTHIV